MWEVVDEHPRQGITERMQVAGGYVYRTRFVDVGGNTTVVAMTFVPDET